MTSGAQDPPPYAVPVDEQGDNVRVYKVHTPFDPTSAASANPDHRVKTQTTTVYTTSTDRNRFVNYESELGRSPGMVTCPSCQEQVLTQVTYKVGTYAWLMCILFILCGFIIGCCLLPFFLKFFKDVQHSCPKCHRVLHVEKKKCC
ncbi:lipopolysaccharide-induced tumor necrosis factor-alpha factor homolog-like [Neoarius graeffei]|uniref:lipopolysaccharide-induced tumor necrosis factor-alpha factor homolog-like n=1 Tax=Neoarius graeffei TaxID=443677 RepID=UPI00298D16B4|nr:lipopolysaccharide-induced tumor necrosis factor-alpha factor homolog-like [Neoarius graeffei]XP_060757084.1 lipopolysaccharide-induced tumor necrosis factor-alpha factor homolog-like [Neoarius graeffei]